MFSFPVLFCLFVGQLTCCWRSPWTLRLAVVNPKVGWVVLPWLLLSLDRHRWLQTVDAGAALLSVAFILSPTWVGEWLSTQPGMAFYAGHASNLLRLIPSSWPDGRVWASLVLGLLAMAAGF